MNEIITWLMKEEKQLHINFTWMRNKFWILNEVLHMWFILIGIHIIRWINYRIVHIYASCVWEIFTSYVYEIITSYVWGMVTSLTRMLTPDHECQMTHLAPGRVTITGHKLKILVILRQGKMINYRLILLSNVKSPFNNSLC